MYTELLASREPCTEWIPMSCQKSTSAEFKWSNVKEGVGGYLCGF